MSLDQLKGQSQGLMKELNKQRSINEGKGASGRKAKEEENGAEKMLAMPNIEFLDTVASMKGFENEIGDIYICILFDLMLYKYPELNQTAFELLIRYFNRKSSLLECLSNIQILESKKSIDILNKVKVYQTQLKIF